MPIGVLKCVMAIWNALFIYTFICASCDGGAVDIICTKYIYIFFIDCWGVKRKRISASLFISFIGSSFLVQV